MEKIKKYSLIAAIIIVCAGVGFYLIWLLPNMENKNSSKNEETIVELPQPKYDSQTSVEEALLKRRSIRDYSDEPLALAEISQLLWAAQGITNERGFRTAPSAGALYPLELYLVIGQVEGLAQGVYKYRPDGHQLEKISQEDKRADLARAALGQSAVKEAAAMIVFAAVYQRTTSKYGERGIRYVHIEVGHAAENVYLEAVSLNLGTVVIGAFDEKEIKRIIKMADEEEPVYLMPVGKK
ncbi:MAG: SagB/ThcOx family dehydrogenase [Candidatus Portnoybacteria bacterium]|nr:SagB/ThcOx family dehydrogenase [Candidatus Portnoybacteria bacterium]